MGGAQRVIAVGNIMTEKKKGGKTSGVSAAAVICSCESREAENDSSSPRHLFEITAAKSQEERGRVDGTETDDMGTRLRSHVD